MLGPLPCLVTVRNFDLRPARRMTTHAVFPRWVDSAAVEAAAVQSVRFALPTCFAIRCKNLRPCGVAFAVPAVKPPDLSVVTTFGATTLTLVASPRFFDEPNLRPVSF